MSDWIKLLFKFMKRLPMRIAIGNLIQWQPLEDVSPGYTIVMGCMRSLSSVATANLRMISKQHLPNLHELVLVFDCAPDEIPQIVQPIVEELQNHISVRVIGYTPKQVRISHLINWGWVYAWLSWCIGVGAAKTKYVILHDLDAMPVAPGFFENIFENIVNSGAQFHGVRQRTDYPEPEKNVLAATFELAIDIEYLRKNHRAIDVFNKLKLINGKYVDFDTFLYIQWLSPLRCVTAVKGDLVHPSQLICYFTDFVAGRKYVSQISHNLLILPYFSFLGGDPQPIQLIAPKLSKIDADRVPFQGKELAIDRVSPEQWAWMEKQIRRLEQTQFGHTRQEVEAYLVGFIDRAGVRRTVGTEDDDMAVLNR